MTLIVTANVQDHLILAGDHCATLSRISNQGPPELMLDNYRKVYPWKYGAIAASGDVFLMVYFCRLFQRHARKGGPINLLQIAKEAKATRSASDVHPSQSTGYLFFTLPGKEGFDLHFLSIGESVIEREIVEPVSTRFAVFKAAPEGSGYDESTRYDDFTSRLRPSFFFKNIDAFYRHHIDLLKEFFLMQCTFDDRVTASFDVYIMDRRTGIGTFWQISEPQKQLAFVQLSDDESDTEFSASAFDAHAILEAIPD